VVWFVDADLHPVRAPVAGLLQGRFQECTTEAVAASCGYDVQLGEVALEAVAPDRLAKTKNREPVGRVADEQDDSVSTLQQVRDSLRECLDRRCRLLELAVEVVQ
jgi:hypothetical protein